MDNSVHRSPRSPIALALLISVLASLAGCSGPDPIRVGFVAQLSGTGAELGDQERDGAQLAVDEINADGGVAGRRINLVVKDDLGTQQGAQIADRALVGSGAVAIIGHATSQQVIAGLKVTEPAHVVMLSPTASTPLLSGRVDYFFRMMQAQVAPQQFARHIAVGRRLLRLSVLYDQDNLAYSRGYLQAFLAAYQPLGGVVVARAGFSSKAKPDFTPLLARLRASKPDGLLMITSDLDTALIAQRTRLLGWQVPMVTSAWAQTPTLINGGGRAVEGMEIEIPGCADTRMPRCAAFRHRYQARFGVAPSFGGEYAYDAVRVLALALKRTDGSAKGLPQRLVEIKNFPALNGTLSIDKYGEAARPIQFGVIREGAFQPIG